MKSYLIIDAIQTTALFVLMIKFSTKLYSNRAHIEHASLLLLVPIFGIAQVLVSSFGVIFIKKDAYIYVQKITTNSYVIVEISVLLYVYFKKIKNKLISVAATLFFITTLCLYLIYDYFFESEIDFWASFSTAEAILFVVICLYVYLEIIFDNKIIDIYKCNIFYFNTGVFFLFSTTLPLYLFDAVIQENLKVFLFQYIAINGLSYVSFYALLIKSINQWKKPQE